jgi:hypothetical protein
VRGRSRATLGGMCESARATVTGLLPRAVRLELDAGQAELLVHELVSSLESRAGSLREDHERHGTLAPAELAAATEWLFEYRTLLEALNTQPQAMGPGATRVITASTVAADALVRACAARASEALRELLPARSGEITALRDAGAAAAAWAQTLADLRELDESAPDTVLE